jgi:hypothetical protein
MSSVMMTLGLSDGSLSDDMVINSERIDGILPRGLVMLTLGVAVDIDTNDGDLGRGICAGEIYGIL